MMAISSKYFLLSLKVSIILLQVKILAPLIPNQLDEVLHLLIIPAVYYLAAFKVKIRLAVYLECLAHVGAVLRILRLTTPSQNMIHSLLLGEPDDIEGI
jgi:hypothetical protein